MRRRLRRDLRLTECARALVPVSDAAPWVTRRRLRPDLRMAECARALVPASSALKVKVVIRRCRSCPQVRERREGRGGAAPFPVRLQVVLAYAQAPAAIASPGPST